MTCRKSFFRAVHLYGGGTCLLKTRCRGAIDDTGRCQRCGGMYGNREARAFHDLVPRETIKFDRDSS